MVPYALEMVEEYMLNRLLCPCIIGGTSLSHPYTSNTIKLVSS